MPIWALSWVLPPQSSRPTQGNQKFLEAQGPRRRMGTAVITPTRTQSTTRYTVDLSALEPLAAMPHMPDNVRRYPKLARSR